MTFKNLAKKAKNRLSSANVNHEKSASKALAAYTSYYISASKPKASDDPLYSKCKKMLESSPDIISPIGKLIEKDIYENLSSVEKDKYLLELTRRFHAMKEQFIFDKQNANS